MRPTGRLHLGHLVGALDNWVNMQDEYDCTFGIVDWHVLSSEYQNVDIIKESVFAIAVDWLASGLDPDRSTLMLQSMVPEHAELHLLFSMIVPVPWLERVPTYKELIVNLKGKDLSTYGFLGYPVLQAADILIYKGDVVPVGEDQVSHIELCREIARRFNHLYGEVFPAPDTLLAPTSKLLGLDRRKMSKSYNNAIFLSDAKEEVRQKVTRMITDPQRARKSDPGRPEVCNVFSFHEIYTSGEKVQQIDQDCRKAAIGCVECKNIMAENLNIALEPIREKRRELEANIDKVKDIMVRGDERARSIARETMEEVREVVKI